MCDVLTGFLLLGGAIFILVAAVGLLRLPDVLTRMQATSKATTLGLAGIMAAAALHAGTLDTAIRVTFIVTFTFMTAPIGAHMIGRAAYRTSPSSARRLVVDDLARAPMQAARPAGAPGRSPARVESGTPSRHQPAQARRALVCIGPGDDWRDTLGAARLDRHFGPGAIEVLCPEGFDAHHVRAWSSLALDRLHTGRHDIVVMGSPSARPEFESAARVLVRRSPVPVWLSQRPERHADGPLLVAIEAPADRRRASTARDLLQQASVVARAAGREWHVVHAWTAFGDDLLSHRAGPDEVAAYRDAEARRARAMLYGLIVSASLDRPPDGVHVRHGEVSDVLSEIAAHLDAAVLMLGTRGRRWTLTATLMPPRAELLFPKVRCALLVLSPGGGCGWAAAAAVGPELEDRHPARRS
jgi:multicomponent Na+:H+ antiporter subunit G